MSTITNITTCATTSCAYNADGCTAFAVTIAGAATPPGGLAEHAGQTPIEIAPQLVEVGRPLIAIAAAVVTAALTPFGIV